eukprot:6193375-Pleurochrysis_carterae.AAC.1
MRTEAAATGGERADSASARLIPAEIADRYSAPGPPAAPTAGARRPQQAMRAGANPPPPGPVTSGG